MEKFKFITFRIKTKTRMLVLLTLVNIILEVEAPHSKEGKKEKVQGLGGIK